MPYRSQDLRPPDGPTWPPGWLVTATAVGLILLAVGCCAGGVVTLWRFGSSETCILGCGGH